MKLDAAVTGRLPVARKPRELGAIAVLLVALGGGALIGGCGGSDPVDTGDVTLLLPPSREFENTAEKRVLDQIYIQALRHAGYKVKRGPRRLITETNLAALESGRVSGYPEHLSTSLHFDFEFGLDELPAHSHAAYAQLRAGLEKKGLTAFPPTPFGVNNAVGMLRRTAEERGLQTDSDLKGKAEGMALKAPTYCHLSDECLGGIEQHYHTAFERVSYEPGLSVELTWRRPEPAFRYEVLENGESDASMLFTTDGELAGRKSRFVVLKDDKHAFPAGNVVWVTSSDVIDEAGPDYEKAIVAAQKGLTLRKMQELNAEIELRHRSPAEVAREYLRSIHMAG